MRPDRATLAMLAGATYGDDPQRGPWRRVAAPRPLRRPRPRLAPRRSRRRGLPRHGQPGRRLAGPTPVVSHRTARLAPRALVRLGAAGRVRGPAPDGPFDRWSLRSLSEPRPGAARGHVQRTRHRLRGRRSRARRRDHELRRTRGLDLAAVGPPASDEPSKCRSRTAGARRPGRARAGCWPPGVPVRGRAVGRRSSRARCACTRSTSCRPRWRAARSSVVALTPSPAHRGQPEGEADRRELESWRWIAIVARRVNRWSGVIVASSLLRCRTTNDREANDAGWSVSAPPSNVVIS